MYKGILVDFDATLFNTWINPYTQENKGVLNWAEIEKNIPQCPLYDGWIEAFEYLKMNNKPIGIVSHCTKGYITKTLKYWSLTDVFSCVFGRYGNGTRYSGKVPKNKLIELALNTPAFRGIRPRDVLYLSDQVKDMPITRLIGAIPIGCLWGSHEIEQLKNEGCKCIENPLELIFL